MYNELPFSELQGKTLMRVENIDNERIMFECADGTSYELYHMQDCCESVKVEEIIGDLADLVGNPILQAEEVNNEGAPPPAKDFVDSYTWTFYKAATIKGSVTIRWLGESNGYYSESVTFSKTSR